MNGDVFHSCVSSVLVIPWTRTVICSYRVPFADACHACGASHVDPFDAFYVYDCHICSGISLVYIYHLPSNFPILRNHHSVLLD